MSSEKVVCPKCGNEQYKRSAICKKCGLIFEKWKQTQDKKDKEEKRAAREQKQAEKAARLDAMRAGSGTKPAGIWMTVILLGLLAAGVVYWVYPEVRPGGMSDDTGTGAAPSVPPGKAAGPPGRGPAPGGGGAPGSAPWKIERPVTGAPPPAAQGQAGGQSAAPAGPGPTLAQAQAYEEYKNRLTLAIGALKEMEQKVQRGLTFEEMRSELPRLMQSVAGAIPKAPTAYNSYADVQRALDAYDMSMRLWEYRAYSNRYENNLWCPGTKCKYQSEKEFQQAVRDLVSRCWAAAIRFREDAEVFLNTGDPLSREKERTVKEEIDRRSDEVKRLWAELSSPGPTGAPKG